MRKKHLAQTAFALLLAAGASSGFAQMAPGGPITPEERPRERAAVLGDRSGAVNPGYGVNWKIEAPLVAAGTAWTLYGFSQVYNKPNSDINDIRALNRDDINGFDRWAAGKSSKDADRISNYPFYGAIPAPLLLIGLDRNVRKDAGRVAFLYLEAMAITGTLYTGATFLVDRYRPETYDLSIPEGDRTGGNYKNSFFAGHVANVATITFFTAKVFNDYHPRSPWRWAFWGGATAATATTVYLRHEAGKHWPTDLALGTAVGVASGILVPHLHKHVRADGRGFSMAPLVGPANGVTLSYRF